MGPPVAITKMPHEAEYVVELAEVMEGTTGHLEMMVPQQVVEAVGITVIQLAGLLPDTPKYAQ